MNSLVFLCHPYHRGGVTSWMAEAAKEAAKQGIITYFITATPATPFISMGNNPSMVELLNKPLENLQIVAPKAGFEFELGTEEYRGNFYKKSILENVPKGTAIIVSDDPSVWLGAVLISETYPVIGVIHSSIDPGYFSLTKKYYKYLSSLVCVSNRTKVNLIKKVPALPTETHIIPCGISLASYKTEGSLPPSNNILNIIWIGRLDETSKRISDVPKIAKKLKERNISFQLKVIGDGYGSEALSKAIVKYDLQSEVIYLGWVSKEAIIKEFKKADFLLQTSNYEGMSVAVMEALASGCGVVSSRVSGVEDYENSVYSPDCLLLYETGNTDEAVNKIISISKIPKERRENASYALARNEFSIDSCVRKYLNIAAHCQTSQKSLELPAPLLWLHIKSRTLAFIRKIKFELTSLKS